MANYDGGDMIRILATFIASGALLVNPASVYLEVKNPLGSVATWAWPGSVTRPATGIFYADVLASIGGNWVYRWAGEGTYWAAGEGGFAINHTTFFL